VDLLKSFIIYWENDLYNKILILNKKERKTKKKKNRRNKQKKKRKGREGLLP
jgi:hypothetical protein